MATLDEFSLIRSYFANPVAPQMLGVGDDAARVPMPAGSQLVACKDLLIEGRHFFPDVDPRLLGHKSLAVNLSDLAAMGAKPLACLLGIGLRQADPQWLEAFSGGLLELARLWDCPLVGGDTVRVRTETVISVTALGSLPEGQQGLMRSAAVAGDDIWISGYLGAPHVALLALKGDARIDSDLLARTRSALEQPQPRLTLGQSLLGLAHAAIDISDGLVQDLGHVAQASQCLTQLRYADLPIDPRLSGLPEEIRTEAVLRGGDVYELCFTAPASRRQDIERIGRQLKVPLACAGQVLDGHGVQVLASDGSIMNMNSPGFDHFRESSDV